MLFAHLKSSLKLDRLRLRGLSGAADEFTLAATVQNLRRMAELPAQGPPIDRIGAPAWGKNHPINQQTGYQNPVEASDKGDNVPAS
jgi:hypothetical protein